MRNICANPEDVWSCATAISTGKRLGSLFPTSKKEEDEGSKHWDWHLASGLERFTFYTPKRSRRRNSSSKCATLERPIPALRASSFRVQPNKPRALWHCDGVICDPIVGPE